MYTTPGTTIRFAAAAAGTALALIMSSPAFAADAAQQEVATAEQHAGYAAASENIKAVHMHLHHVINCLVGPDGAGFDANEANPCKDLGNGAIADSTDDTAKQALDKAVQEAQDGLKTDDLAAAQKAATETASMLKAQSM